MVNLIQNLLVNFYSRKKSKFRVQAVSNLLKEISNVLVILPEDEELIQDTKFIITVLDKVFMQKTFLLSSNIYKKLELLETISVLTYDEKNKNFVKLPKKEFLNLLKSKNFDAVIDCNLKDSNFHYWITKSIDAKFKIGLYRKNSTAFNNLVLKLQNFDNTRSIYKNLLYLLKL